MRRPAVPRADSAGSTAHETLGYMRTGVPAQATSGPKAAVAFGARRRPGRKRPNAHPAWIGGAWDQESARLPGLAPILGSPMFNFFSRFVDSNDRELKRIQPFVDEANDLEDEIKALSDAEIRERFTALRDEFRETVVPEEPPTTSSTIPISSAGASSRRPPHARDQRRSRSPSTTSFPRPSRWPARRWSGRSGCATSTSS